MIVIDNKLCLNFIIKLCALTDIKETLYSFSLAFFHKYYTKIANICKLYNVCKCALYSSLSYHLCAYYNINMILKFKSQSKYIYLNKIVKLICIYDVCLFSLVYY